MVPFDGTTHPHEVVRAAIASERRSQALVVHSTSWRHDAETRTLILTYVAVIAVRSLPRGFVEQRVERAPLARGGATTPARARRYPVIVEPHVAQFVVRVQGLYRRRSPHPAPVRSPEGSAAQSPP